LLLMAVFACCAGEGDMLAHAPGMATAEGFHGRLRRPASGWWRHFAAPPRARPAV